ncbi:MAG: hypothetical protein IJJ68_06395 [Prevotella sp.]|nr:hypothetical protein [Prevotella sp.]
MMILRVLKNKLLLMMLITVLSAQSVWAQKVEPKLLINLSSEFNSVPVGQANFTKPDVSLKTYEADEITVKEDVTSYYTITYYILNGEETQPTYTRDANNRDISTDNTTGTTVSKSYGTVTIGHKGGGTVTVWVKATPKAAFAEQYKEKTGSYTFTVTSVTPTVVLPAEMTIHAFTSKTENSEDNTLYDYLAKSEVLALPAKNLYVTSSTGFKQDLSALYNISYSFTLSDGTTVTEEIGKDSNGNMVINLNPTSAYKKTNEEISALEPINKDYKLKVTYTVADKETYGGYNDAEGEVTIHVIKNDFQTLTASLNFAEDHSTKETAIVFSRWNDKEKTGYNAQAMHPLPVPTVTNSAGADISNKVRIKYDIVSEESEYDDCQRNHMNQWGEVWEADESTQGSLNPGYYNHIGTNNTNPFYQNYKPGYIKIRAYAVTNLVDEAYNEFAQLSGEGYDLGENEFRISEPKVFYIYIQKRKPTIVLSPNPENITLSTANAIDMNSRFDIKGYVTDENDGTAGTVSYGAQWGAGDDTFWYTFEFTKDSGIEVVDWPHADRVEMYVEVDDTDNPGQKKEVKAISSMEWGEVEKDEDNNPVYGMKEVIRDASDWSKIYKKEDVTRFVYWSVKGFGTDNVWKMKFTKATDACQIKYRIYPFNHSRWDVSDEFTVTYKIVNAIEPTLNIDPDHLSALVNQADFVEPEVWVTNPEGKEITSDFKFKYTITSDGGTGTTVSSPSGDNYTAYGKPDHEISIGSTPGDVTVQVEATTIESENSNAINYNPQTLTGTYTIHVFNNESSNPLYEIINSKDVETFTNNYAAAADSRMGKMHFINTGNLYTGYSIDGIPGLIMRFGKYDGSVWNIIADSDVSEKCNSKDNSQKCIAYDETPVVLNEDGIATAGAFLEFTSATNGLLRVDARWEVGQSYTLIDFDYPDVVQTYTPTATTKGEYTFPYPLLADHSYQLYCSTEGQLNFHGIGFDPVFIKTREGGKVTKGSSFLNGYQNVPSLALDNTTNVTYIVDEATNLNTSSAKCAEIENAAVHKVTAKNFTILDKAATTMPDATTSTDVVIQGKVMSSLNAEAYAAADVTHTHGIPFKLPYYQLSIADIPTYRLGDGLDTKSGLNKDASNFTPTPGTEVTTYNIPTAITMTYGGWKNKYTSNNKENQDTYEFKTDNEVAGYTKTDNQFSRHIDGFSWSNVGKTNPVNENNVGNYRAYRWTNDKAESDTEDADEFYHNTFDLPAKGAYWKFEPEEDGVIFVYLVQNGVCQYTGNSNDLVNTTKTPHGLDWKPLYVVDESGKPADMLDATSMATIDDFVASGGTGAGGTDDESDAYTEGLVRANVSDANIMRFRSMIGSSTGTAQTEADFNTELAALRTKLANAATEYAAGNKEQAKLDSCMYQWTYNNSKGVETGFAIDYKDADKLEQMKLQVLNHWAKAGERQVIFQDVNGPGYAMVSKAYVRYAINAKAGKTYWVFQQGSKPNLCGFGFVPYWFPNKSKVDNQAITLDDNTSLAESLSGKDLTKTSTVTYNRTFKNNTWTSLCLPFSVSQRNFKKVFGENAEIVTYDGVTNSGTNAHFIQHNYRMMEAGRGYFIKPAWDSETTQKTSVVFENVTIETKVDDDNEFTATTLTNMPALNKFTMFDHEEYKTQKKQALRMVGTFDGEDMPAYSYFINGKLYRITKAKHCGRYRAYLKNPGENAVFSRLGGSTFEQPFEDTDEEKTVTKINGVHEFKGEDMTDLKLADGIFNVAGQKVADKNVSTSDLSKGIYIINGKKVVIK